MEDEGKDKKLRAGTAASAVGAFAASAATSGSPSGETPQRMHKAGLQNGVARAGAPPQPNPTQGQRRGPKDTKVEKPGLAGRKGVGLGRNAAADDDDDEEAPNEDAVRALTSAKSDMAISTSAKYLDSTSAKYLDIETSKPNLLAVGMPEAKPVEEQTGDIDIGIAIESEDLAVLERERDKRNRRWSAFMIIGFCCVLAIIVAVAVLVTGNGTTAEAPTVSPTSSPTESPSMAPSAFIVDNLPDYTLQDIIANFNALDGTRTPQSMAYQWLLNDPQWREYTDEQRRQRLALAILHYSTTQSGPWSFNSSWLSYEHHECDWYSRLSTFPLENNVTYPCDEDGQYIHLVLTNDNLVGTLPPEISLLTALKTIDLGDNALSKTLPTEVGLLRNLDRMTLDYNPLTGSIPSEVAYLENLQVFFVARTQFEGTVPSLLWQMTALREISLSEIPSLTGTLPTEVGYLTNLESLTMHFEEGDATSEVHTEGRWKGTIPSEIGQMTKLTELDLELSGLSGWIPTELGLLTALTGLNLNFLNLTGSLPSEIGNAVSLKNLYVYGSNMIGTVPTEFGMLTNITKITFSHNQLTGSFPLDLLKLTNLGSRNSEEGFRYFDLSGNQFTGTLPSELGTMVELDVLVLHDNQFTGALPSELGAMSGTKVLHLQNNQWTGTIPSEYGMLQVSNFWAPFFVGGSPYLTGLVPPELCGMIDVDPSHSNCTETQFCGCGCDCVSDDGGGTSISIIAPP